MEGGLNRAGIQLVELFHIVQDGVQLTGEELLFLFGKLQSCQECYVFDLSSLNLHLLPHIYLESRCSPPSSPPGERREVRGKIIFISTGQRATFGLTPALSRQR